MYSLICSFISFQTFFFYYLLFITIVDNQGDIYIKRYDIGPDVLVAVCDIELIGKHLEEGGLTLEVSESFYKGEAVTESEVVASLRQATIANLVGERAVRCALANSFIEEANVIFIGGVPHAQMVRI